MPRNGKHQTEGKVRRGIGRERRHVGNRYAARSRRFDVDVSRVDGLRGDHSQIGIRSDHAGVNAVVQETEQDFALADSGKHRAPVQDATRIRIHRYGSHLPKPRNGAFCHGLSDEDARTMRAGHYATQPWTNPSAVTTPA
jgi:hypothetical protein